MKKVGGRTALIALILIAVAVSAAVAVAQASKPEAVSLEDDRVDLTNVKEDRIRDMYDSDGHWVNPKQRYVDAAIDNPGGFGGWYREGTVVYVWMEDPTNQSAAEAAFRQAYTGDLETTAIVPVQAKHSYDKLWNWWETLELQMSKADLAVTYINVVSQENTIRIGLLDLAESETVKEIMALNEIPDTAVTIVQTDVIAESQDNPTTR